MFSFGDVPTELYRWFLLTYGVSAAGRIIVEAVKQVTVLQTAWYDVPTTAFNVLERGFVPHALLSLAAAEGINMVLGALMKRKARTEGREQGQAEGREQGRAETNKAWREWLGRRETAEANGQPFNEPPPDSRN